MKLGFLYHLSKGKIFLYFQDIQCQCFEHFVLKFWFRTLLVRTFLLHRLVWSRDSTTPYGSVVLKGPRVFFRCSLICVFTYFWSPEGSRVRYHRGRREVGDVREVSGRRWFWTRHDEEVLSVTPPAATNEN